MNILIISGNTTADGTIRYTKSGTAVLSFTVANNEKISQDSEETLFMECAIFGKRAEALAQYITKGTKLLVQGRLSQNNWVDKNGNKRVGYSLIVDKLEFIGAAKKAKGGRMSAAKQKSQEEDIPAIDVDDTEFPF